MQYGHSPEKRRELEAFARRLNDHKHQQLLGVAAPQTAAVQYVWQNRLRLGSLAQPSDPEKREEYGLRVLRVIEADLARYDWLEEEDVGKFWFVPGYSRAGGPDIIRREE